ncbi:cytochrome-c oxidase, cbb3-type subunit III [Luteimonas terricola]|uniref:Cbb3-type cytochrome c oxidase subunit n=1 Tax=Luteimonas terricola TaxID=645597 RepID=A0ABQ2EF58_9GAMM|nr:cytochrome-c oxidase, cbb3-type subunit III [Luteimonas terricola]GGK05766.1 Cbb3-type cytochrome c oxidase subunit [Luteimonas terricola]
MTTGWSIYVIVLVLLNIAGLWALLAWTARRRPGDPKPDDTSHVWDGDITEYNKPLPRWWIIGFYLTMVYAVGYLIWYPGLGNFKGISGWTSAGEHDADKVRQDAILAETFRPYDGQPISALAGDPRALELGRAIFANTCATCHGSSAQGAVGYPNLTDDIWHWGGSEERILESVLDGRQGVMPEWGTVLTGMGGENAVLSVATYTRSLAGEVPANDYFAAQGKGLYEGVCVACHGIDGTGNQDLGAPDLTDDYAMYGNSVESIMETINKGRHGVMPAHRDLLGETRSRLVASYVWSLSRAEGDQAQSADAQ